MVVKHKLCFYLRFVRKKLTAKWQKKQVVKTPLLDVLFLSTWLTWCTSQGALHCHVMRFLLPVYLILLFFWKHSTRADIIPKNSRSSATILLDFEVLRVNVIVNKYINRNVITRETSKSRRIVAEDHFLGIMSALHM